MSTPLTPVPAPEIATDAIERELVTDAVRERWSLERLEREYILAVLNEMGGHRGRTADILGIDRRTLYRKLRAYGVKGARQGRREADANEASMRMLSEAN